uniref:Uncharacterized protein n=1 Tax=Pyramimonas orientalis virus TaxID=455367 RepID=A0A7M3UNV8_POV01|nr:hypothetical protein HWQ62_00260 [Pyramimonas orientalis virus]
MKELVVFTYIVMTICTTIYTYLLTKRDEDYMKEVHAHMASIMFFHATIISIVVATKPSFTSNIYVSLLNTALSIMFSILFYMTNKEDKVMLYTYNGLYLVFASILVSEFIVYFGNDTFINSIFLIFAMFLCDIVFYKKENDNKLMMVYGAMVLLMMLLGLYDTQYIVSVAITGLYGLVVLAYMYYDHEHLVTVTTKYHLDDALKYFLDFEGMIVRTINNYIE